MAASRGKTNPGIRGWEPSAAPLNYRERRGAGDWVIKTLKQDSGSFRASERTGTLGGWRARRGSPSLAPPFQYLALCISSVWLFLRCILCNKPLTVKCFPNSVSHSSKLSNLMRGSWEPPIYSQLVRSTGGSGLVTGA